MALALRRRFGGFRPRVARARTRIVTVARRVGSTVKQKNKHRMVALGAAAAAGFARGSGTTIPHVEKLGVEGTYGGLFLLWAMSGGPAWVDHAATGLLSVAIHQAAQEAGGGTSGDFDAGALDFDDQAA
jgi:hypothetical protein